jgi:putative ABC transport system substrate-binding protein
MKRFIGLLSIFVTLAAGGVAVQAQQPKKVYRIGYLSSFDPAGESARSEGIWLALRELGYVEGQNIAIEYRYAEGKRDRFPELAAELVRLKPDVIVTPATPASLAAKEATSTIPIVFAGVADAVGAGLVPNLVRPGGNITGLTTISAELSGKRLELLKELVPRASHVAVLYNPDDVTKTLDLLQTGVPARALGVTLPPAAVRDPAGFEPAFAALLQARARALISFGDVFTLRHRAEIVDFAAKHQLPAMYELRAFVQAGGLMAYGPRLADMVQQIALYVDRLLKGAKPADLPVEQPMKFELVINLKTAQALGHPIPPTLLFQADEVLR